MHVVSYLVYSLRLNLDTSSAFLVGTSPFLDHYKHRTFHGKYLLAVLLLSLTLCEHQAFLSMP